MDFSWSPTQQARYEAARQFVAGTLVPRINEPRPAAAFCRSAWESCGQFGLLGLPIATEFGGQGLDALTSARVVEAFGRECADRGLLFAAAAHLYAVTIPIAEHGSDAVKRRWLPQLTSGKCIGAHAITEEQAGSDVWALQTRAELQGEGEVYRLNGLKSFVTNGPVADLFLTYAVTEPAHGYLGVSAFLVERANPGVEVLPAFEKTGLASAQASAVRFTDCLVPAAQMLGDPGAAAQLFSVSMRWERACLFAIYTGMLERQLDQTIAHVRRRKQFGKTLGQHQAVAHRIAEMKLRLESARLLLYQACWQLAQGNDGSLEGCLSKLAISEAAVRSSLDAIQLHGAAAIQAPNEFDLMLRDALPATIFSGTSEIQRDLIARELGL